MAYSSRQNKKYTSPRGICSCLSGRAATAGVLLLLLLASCARMGKPDGGWYDETPPRMIGAVPSDGGTGVKARKIQIFFDEFIKLDNPTEKVVVSPPQLEPPEIKGSGRQISIELHDTLQDNTTYTIDFSDAISDNNEGNPMGNFTYSFSTGEVIDTLEVSGHVLEAENLEPVKGILVGLYAADSPTPTDLLQETDTLSADPFVTRPMLRVSRTDSRGRFVIKGVAPGTYQVVALQDMDGNYMFSQKSEKVAFTDRLIIPSAKADIRQDTLWSDSLHIQDIRRVGYTHFLPDDIVLRAFTEPLTDRYLIKSERPLAECFSLYFSFGSDSLPTLRGLNFDDEGAWIVESNGRKDSINYWLRDTALVNQDTLVVELRYEMTDTLGRLQPQTDTLQLLSKQPLARRLKAREKTVEEWQKKQDKLKKRGLPYDSIMPADPLKLDIGLQSKLDPDKNIRFKFPTPLANYDPSKIHLYGKSDSVWYRVPFEFVAESMADTTRQATIDSQRTFMLRGEWRPNVEYSLELDSAAFTDLYGHVSQKSKNGFKVSSLDEYGTLLINISGMVGRPLIVQLLNAQDKPVKEVVTRNGRAEFFYLQPGSFYLRMIVDDNGNGLWDTGDYAAGRQPEAVYYYPEAIECRAKWDITEDWNPTARPLDRQKPSAIVQQKADKEKRIHQRNAARARKLGITYTP